MKMLNITFILLLVTSAIYAQYITVNEKTYAFVYNNKKHSINELVYMQDNKTVKEYRMDNEVLVMCRCINDVFECDYNADGDFEESIIITHVSKQVKWIISNISKFQRWF